MEEGLRERKKRETRQRISDMATGLFMARGFDNVTVAEVARAADVSVNTVFNYFPTKEDLLMDRQEAVEAMPVEVLRGRRPGESAVAAFRRDYLEAIETRHWRHGLQEGSATFTRLIEDSPALRARMHEVHLRREEALARALAEEAGAGDDDVRPRVVATQILGTTRVLSGHAMRAMLAGQAWESIAPTLKAQAEAAFDLLESGTGGYGVRPPDQGPDQTPENRAAPPAIRKTRA